MYQLNGLQSRYRSPASVLRGQHEARPGVVAIVIFRQVPQHSLLARNSSLRTQVAALFNDAADEWIEIESRLDGKESPSAELA
jgi:hypothetical protein